MKSISTRGASGYYEPKSRGSFCRLSGENSNNTQWYLVSNVMFLLCAAGHVNPCDANT
jgi:hypothetical protein